MAVNERRTIVLKRLFDQFRNNVEPHVQVLSNVKDVTDSSVPDRKGAFGKIIDLDWEGKQCVGKELHEIMFLIGTDVEMTAWLQKFCKEIKMMSKLKHDNIVTFYGICYKQLQSAGSVAFPVLVMERLEFSLRSYIDTTTKGAISNAKIAEILFDVARGLVYLHEGCGEPLAHRDLSSNNILLTSRLQAKIADFGESRALDKPGGWDSSAKLTDVPGTLVFMPPETWEDPPHYTTAIDIFSFGCVIIHLVTWQWPQPDAQIRRVTNAFGEFSKIIGELERRKKWISMFGEHHPLLPIVKQCLQDKIDNRPKCKELLSLCKKAYEIYATRNILVIGKSGCGKSSLINNVIGEDCLQVVPGLPDPSTTAQHVSRELSINNTKYQCTFIELPCAIYGHNRLYNKEWIMQTTNPCQREYLKRLNLIIYMKKLGRLVEEDRNSFVYTKIFPQTESISALVITYCDSKNNAARTRIVEDFKSNGEDIAASMGKGIYTVGFPDLTELDDEYVTTSLIKSQKDASKLHQLIEESSDSVAINVTKESSDSSPVCPFI